MVLNGLVLDTMVRQGIDTTFPVSGHRVGLNPGAVHNSPSGHLHDFPCSRSSFWPFFFLGMNGLVLNAMVCQGIYMTSPVSGHRGCLHAGAESLAWCCTQWSVRVLTRPLRVQVIVAAFILVLNGLVLDTMVR